MFHGNQNSPNPLIVLLMLTAGCGVAAMFLKACYPSTASTIQQSFGGLELAVLIGFLFVGTIGIGMVANIVQAALKLLMVAAQLALLALVCFGVFSLWQARSPRAQQDQAIVPMADGQIEVIKERSVVPEPPARREWWEEK